VIARRRITFAAMAVALAATVLTSRANAQSDPPHDTDGTSPARGRGQNLESSAATESATPLALRSSKPLELAPEPTHSGLGWKVVAVLAILGGGAFYLRKRIGPKRIDDGQLTIVRRTAIGIRSELLVVNVEGQRMLLGVTPHSIQSLAVLDGEEAAEAPASDSQAPDHALEHRFAALLKSTETRAVAARADAMPRAEDEVAGQARGLLALRRQG
jgi:flagellar protein FliO/FliZ